MQHYQLGAFLLKVVCENISRNMLGVGNFSMPYTNYTTSTLAIEFLLTYLKPEDKLSVGINIV